MYIYLYINKSKSVDQQNFIYLRTNMQTKYLIQHEEASIISTFCNILITK